MEWHACFRGTQHISTEVKNQRYALKVNDGWTPGCFWPEAMKHPNQCRYGGHLCLSEPGSVSQWLTSCLPQTDTCCVSWQVGSWGSWSPNLLLLLLLLLLELEPRGQTHFTPYNPWLCAPVPPERLKCKTKPTSVHRLSKLVKVLSCAEMP